MGCFNRLEDHVREGWDEFKHGKSPLNSFLTLGLSDLARKEQLGSAVFKKMDKISGLEGKGWKNPFTGEKQGINESTGNIAAAIATIWGGAGAAAGMGAFGSGGLTGAAGGSAAGGSAAGAGETIGSGLTGTFTGAAAPATAESAIGTGLTGTLSGAYTMPASIATAAPEFGAGTLAAGSTIAGGAGAASPYAGLLGSTTVGGAGAAAGGGGGLLSGLGTVGKALPLITGAANIASQYMKGKADQESIAAQQAAMEQAAEDAALANKGLAEEAVDNNRQWWQENAYPNQVSVDAKAAEANASLGERLAMAKRKYSEDAAARGLRGGSLAGGLSSLDRSAQTDYARIANELIQFQNTPRFTPQGTSLSYTPQSAAQILPTTNSKQVLANAADDLTKTYLTYQMYQNMM